MKREKTTAILLVVLLTSMAFGIVPILAVKPSKPLAAAEKVAWNLSGNVMPVPPYGGKDIPGSDTASKLIVNQPNGAVEVVITGVMNGLTPSTTYTVYLSKGYTTQTTWPGLFTSTIPPFPFTTDVYGSGSWHQNLRDSDLSVDTGWNIEGTWILRIIYGSNYDHDITIDVNSDGTFSGYGGWPAGGPYIITEIVTGTIDVMSGDVFIRSDYEGSTYWYEATGTINPSDGSMSGTWTSSSNQNGNWVTIVGNAVRTQSSLGLHTLSVWINDGGTVLISDNFDVTVD